MSRSIAVSYARGVGLVALTVAAPLLSAASLNLRVESGGQTSVNVAPGATVPYTVVGELSDAQNQGLAQFSLDLAFSGGALTPAAAPTTAPMTSFAVPAGLNNPQGFGGTLRAGRLVQVGGAQNTINNALGSYPTGSVATGVALPGAPVALVSGQLTAPSQPGDYTLSVTRAGANVIQLGASGVPVWKVERAPAGALVPLVVHVQAPLAERAKTR
jgi:hypothetical protein